MRYQKQHFCLFPSAMRRLVAFILLFSAFGAGSARAQWTDSNTGVTFTPTAGTTGNSGESYDKACDGNSATKLCVNGTAGGYVVVHASQAVNLVGYTITTANDNASYTGRNPKNWTIQGSNDGTNWTTLVTVTDDAVLPDKNYILYSFNCTTTGYYEYFKFDVTANKGGSCMQYSEFHPVGTLQPPAQACVTHGATQAATSTSTNVGYAVTYDNTNYFNGVGAGSTTFIPESCIWTGSNGTTWTNGVNNLYGDYTFTLTGTESGTTGQGLNMTYNSNTYYLRWTGSAWNLQTTNSNNKVLYAVSKVTYTESYTNPAFTISSSFISSTGASAATCTRTTDAAYTPGYIDYVFYNGAHHYVKSDNHTAISAVPAAETFTYTWGLEGIDAQYATINGSTGVISYHQEVASSQLATVTLTATSATHTITVCQQVTFNPASGGGGSTSTSAGYVFTYLNQHFLGGQTANTDITTFNPSTCLWTGTSGNYWQNSAGYYLTLSSSYVQTSGQTNTMTLTGNESGTTGQKIYRSLNTSTYYLRYDSTNGWQRNRTTDDQNTVVFAVTKHTYSASFTAPTISGDAVIAYTGTNSSFNKTNAAYTRGYYDYVFYNNTSHRFELDNSTSLSAAPTGDSFNYTWSLEGIGSAYATINSSTGVITYSSYVATDVTATVKLTATSTRDNSISFVASQQVTFQAPRVNPTGISATSPMTVYVGQTGQITYTLTPAGCYNNVSYQSASTSVATVSNGTVTGRTAGTTTITLTANKINGASGAPTTTVTVNVRDVVATPSISFAPISDGATATATLSCATSGAAIYYTTNGSTPTTSSTLYNGSFTVSDQATVKAIAVMPSSQPNYTYYDNSAVAAGQYSRCTSAEPVIHISGGEVTFASVDDGATFYYTTNGSTPTTSSTQWNGAAITGLANETVVKVIAKAGSCQPSAVVSRTFIISSGVSGSTVTLNDLEDHNWSYYKGEETTVANTGTTYKDKYRYTLYSPDPRNVKITYNCGSVTGNTVAIKVSPTETENQFIYYKTVEKYVIGFFTDANGNGLPDESANTNEQYAYTVISNPFSVRPKAGSTYYGFAGWKIVSGAEHIGRGASRTQATNGTVLSLDEIVHFINLDNGYTPNCISAEIVLEATWTAATVKTGTTAQTFSGGTYETNFIVATGDIGTITQSSPCTILGMYPDGTSNNSATRTITGLTVGVSTVKVEYIRHGSGTFNANGNNLIMGRGITSSTGAAQGNVFGRNTAGIDCVNTVKVESGYYSRISNIANQTATSSNLINNYTILGCDYDRARANYYVPASEIESNAYNIKLRATRIYGTNGSNPQLNRSNGQLYLRTLFKSGVFASQPSQEYYFHSYYHRGQRYLEMEGGYNKGHIKGGSEVDEPQIGSRSLTVRMRGGRIDGQVGMGSTSNNCYGERVAAITGGRIGGWIAPGSNCSTSGSGTAITEGESYIYFGGTAEINSRQFGITSPELIGGQSTGGVIYGAGLGSSKTSARGQMNGGSNIVLADQAYCERGIYGGGALAQTKATANIFILGGRVGTGMGRIKDVTENVEIDVEAGVFGGACDVGGDTSFIYMSGGVVESGIYGGSNIDGTMTGNTTLRIVGGRVGTDATHEANIHGGGYGASTVVSGNVDVTLGVSGAATDSVEVFGDVYGGSALGKVNGTASNASAHTIVTMYHGKVHGDIYGGGLGDGSNAANVYGPVTVNIHGGEAERVFGCNNTNGSPQQGTNQVNMDGGQAGYLYGGGNAAAYSGSPAVYMNGGHVTEHVFGGGLGSAAVIGGSTSVHITGRAHVTKNVYGGGNAAQVTGNTYVKIE